MNKTQFVELVKQEIETIKAKATDEEKAKLDFEDFNHDKNSQCIYGQMTGECNSMRAIELMPKSFEHAVRASDYWKDGDKFKDHSFRKGEKYTPLEKYLYMVGRSTHANIIAYIKGEIDSLNLTARTQ